MWTRVSLWVMAPGRADRLDSRDDWLFRIADAREQSFSWKGVDYTGGLPESAPAYLDVELPPGSYVAWAERGSLSTHRAVLAVHDEPSVVLRLLPAVPPKPVDPPDDGECRISVDGVRGADVDGSWPRVVEVHGTSAHCPVVHVAIKRQDARSWAEADTTVDSEGRWSAEFPNDLKIECGSSVRVVATCAEDRTCQTKGVFTVDCA